ncbi:hypothetical protein BST81_14490 [Leptolyngbya sp. 'hensonii']|uniref:CHAD domain-containing protein n=1 Tax=Leptolyngbya sp. 'hensonii' TaxID=1922337 RepID=UPI00094FE80D|nr:CHAD domain-containing protein [Leptolyngbya sp. 'hensonii']OLP17540.1 hypothetical protein BST81_14490 [Leptolyngbya sp. 'hensonii']
MKTQTVTAEKQATYGDYAHQMIQQQYKKLLKLESAVLQDVDPEPLHEMRVAMRRLRTALHVFDTVLELPSELTGKAIAKVSRILGTVRDLDVLSADLQTRYAPHLSESEQKKFQRVLEGMQRQRVKAFARLQKTLQGETYTTLKQTLQSWLKHPSYTPLAQIPITQIVPDLLAPLISCLLLHPAWMVATTFREGQMKILKKSGTQAIDRDLERYSEVLHDLRKQMKGVRYQAEFFANFYGPAYADQIRDFKTIQDLLGQLQDSAVLQEFLVDRLNVNLKEEFPSLLQYLHQLRIELWQTWRPLQQRYLSPEFRQQLRLQILAPQLQPTA